VHDDEIQKENTCTYSEQAHSSIKIRKTQVHFNEVYSKKFSWTTLIKHRWANQVKKHLSQS